MSTEIRSQQMLDAMMPRDEQKLLLDVRAALFAARLDELAEALELRALQRRVLPFRHAYRPYGLEPAVVGILRHIQWVATIDVLTGPQRLERGLEVIRQAGY